MTTPVFITVDTEFAWRHHKAGLALDQIYERSLEPAGVGLSYQLDVIARHQLKACFFVDPMPALTYGLDPVRRMVDPILAAGQEVQLHLHPHWTGAHLDDRSAAARAQLHEYSLAEQVDLIAGAAELLMAAGAPRPIAFRAGNYAANDDTLRALATLGFAYDSSHNGAEADDQSRIDLPPRCVSPLSRDVIEVPVTVIEDRPDHLRTFQPCALSTQESIAALDHAAETDHAAVTIVSHSFELATRVATRANRIHVRRFGALCAALDERRDELPTVHFRDRPSLRLDQSDDPLGPDTLRTRRRQAEQFWSNWVSERVM